MIPSRTATPMHALEQDLALMDRYHVEKPWGMASSVDLYGCDSSLIQSAEHIERFVRELCHLIDMRTYGPTLVVNFGDDPRVTGYSMTQLIETSLISGHFANQSQAAYLDIFSCKAYPPLAVAEFAETFFKAETKRVTVQFRY